MYKKLQISVIFLFGFALTSMQAQTMYVKENNGKQIAYILSDVQKMSFSEGNIIIKKTNNNREVYAMSDLRYLGFKDYAANITNHPKLITNATLVTYPNPVDKVLTIDLTEAEVGGTICIFTLEGKLVQMQKNDGGNSTIIDLNHLPQGVYLCQYITTTEVKSAKIIKQ